MSWHAVFVSVFHEGSLSALVSGIISEELTAENFSAVACQGIFVFPIVLIPPSVAFVVEAFC